VDEDIFHEFKYHVDNLPGPAMLVMAVPIPRIVDFAMKPRCLQSLAVPPPGSSSLTTLEDIRYQKYR
jgi:hypothetical protein